MKQLIIPMCAMLLLATSCRSTKNFFKSTDLQQNTSITINESNEMPESLPAQDGKKSYFYHSLDKTVILSPNFEVSKTIADLRVMPDKIEYSCAYNGNDDEMSRKAAVNYAISQALKINGNADIMVEPKYEIKTDDGHITSVKVSGYAAYYCNFRTATQEDLKLLKEGNKNVQVVSKTPQQEAPDKTN